MGTHLARRSGTITRKGKAVDSQIQRVAIVTGASSGIGEATAHALLARGWRVYGASRSDSGRIAAERFHFLALDVTDDDAVRVGVDHVRGREGRIDLVVNNAGFSLVGAVEDTNDGEVAAQLDVNLMGAWRMTRAVLPVMRAQGQGKGQGRIVNVGSIGGSVGLPFQAAYSASKFALAGFTEALSAELAGSGIRAVLVEPGNCRTAIGNNRRRAAAADDSSAYATSFEHALEVIDRDEKAGHSPQAIARAVVHAATACRPALTIRTGPIFERYAPLAKALVPSRWFERLLVDAYC